MKEGSRWEVGSGERPRILHVVNDLIVGGLRNIVFDQCHALAGGRFDLALLTLRDDLDGLQPGDLPTEVETFYARYTPRKRHSVISYLEDAFLPGITRARGKEALQCIIDSSADIVHFHTVPRDLALGILAAKQLRCRLVYTDQLLRIRSDDYAMWSRAGLRLAYRRLYRQYNVICAGSEIEMANRESRFLNPRKHHIVIDNEIDISRFRPGPSTDHDPLVFVYVARLDPVKRHDVLIRAFGQMEMPRPCRLVLVGAGQSRGALEALAAEVVPKNRDVEFLGNRSDVDQILQGCTMGVFPSSREGRPLALLEMMASGLPVIASDIEELASLVRDGQNGLVTRLGDVDALARAMTRLAGDESLRKSMGAAARSAAEQFATTDTAQRLEAYYGEILAGG